MTGTIMTPENHRKLAAMYMHRPSSLIEAVESRQMIRQYQAQSSVYPGKTSSFSMNMLGVAATGIIGTVVLVDIDYPTSGAAVSMEMEPAGQLIHDQTPLAERSWARWSEATKIWLQKPQKIKKATFSASAKLRVDRLSNLQATLGLPNLELAKSLGITRQSLYNWLDVSKEIVLQEINRDRLTAIERVANLWSTLTTVPLSSVSHEPIDNGVTILQLLSEAKVDELRIANALKNLAERLQFRAKSLGQRMAEAGYKRRPSARSLPSDE
ncbi:MAG: hypothetical protein HY847_04515 [Betaproteobacteria bacterium]|nr:hypothetical protein [Betaproteobacteria bacterium]